MDCSSSYAGVSDFVMFWCVGSVTKGQHTGSLDLATLTDVTKNFPAMGVRPGVYLYNVTDGSYTTVELVQTNSLVGALYGGDDNTWETGDQYELLSINTQDALAIKETLDMSSSDVAVALQSSGQCDCTFSEAGMQYLKRLAIVIAALSHNCPCGGLGSKWTDMTRQSWMDWMNKQLDDIAAGNRVLCQGDTGKAYPVMDSITMVYTDHDAARVILNRRMREY